MVFVGGGAGSVLRYLIGRQLNLTSASFPWGTFLVNLAGCLIIGLVFGWILEKSKPSEGLLLFLVAGFCGGFTTFSAYAHESMALLKTGHIALFLTYVLSSIIAGLICVWLGYAVIRAV